MNRPTCKQVFETIREHPGLTWYGLSKLMHTSPSLIKSRLTNMDDKGLLLYEDDYGGLYEFADND